MSASYTRRGMTAAGWVALAGVLLALAAGFWLAFSPVYQGESVTMSSSGVVTRSSESATLIEENGSWAVVLLGIPVVLAALGLLAVLRGWRRLVWVFAGVLFAFVVLAGMSVGLFSFPAALALLVAAGLTGRGRDPGGTRQRVS
jgi:hypothetical protein